MPRSLLSIFMLSLIMFYGCGGDPTAELGKPLTVSGTITLDGKPSANVEIIMKRLDAGAPAQNRQFAAVTDSEGKYSLENVFPASYAVMVNEKKDENGEEEGAAAIETGPYKKYGVNSELKADVTDSKTTFDFELKSK
ncbi:carboxypeptidase-like regulatory domain-containing protein [uncultured Gimesia sp.]|uniref:carboxypeptidase-like regulatory domain-containing protein n=1 Tax=uncultured Gimesia sp. TaxID=1678688 RepID=UPI00260DC525|nr:carboxypeptidase-like regulatory domain-containing protein [uncultured Gimesia sp.]